jgi:hypothetical protein
MYGLVNQAIQGLVTENFGQDSWDKIKLKSNVTDEFFLSDQSYDDDVTFKLAIAASEVLNITVAQVLNAFGEYWVLKIGMEKYGSLMKAGGNNLKEFLVYLPNFHSRVMLMYPKITPPEFQITNETENSVHVHYFSSREGLTDFMQGLLQGIGKLYKVEVEIELIQSRASGNDHDVFSVKW